jgi:hypothetical protein
LKSTTKHTRKTLAKTRKTPEKNPANAQNSKM